MKLLLSFFYRCLYLADRFIRLRPGKPLKKSKFIVVGSIRVGGAGKTPVVLKLAKAFKTKGFSVAILVHSYAFDEELLLKRRMPEIDIIKTRNRATTAKQLDGKYDVIICDDGFEDKRLIPNKVVILDWGEKAESLRELFPSGNCRSLKKDHPEITDTWLCVGKNKVCSFEIKKIISGKSFLEKNKNQESLISNNKFSVACGIGDPIRFVNDLKNYGVEVQRQFFFQDHCKNFEKRVQKILFSSKALVVSEKDAHRLSEKTLRNEKLFIAIQETSIQKETLETFLTSM